CGNPAGNGTRGLVSCPRAGAGMTDSAFGGSVTPDRPGLNGLHAADRRRSCPDHTEAMPGEVYE
ncbi:MAG: hypothetical protein WAU16_16800, partial [Rhizobiaceae bacterium]